MPNNDPKKSAVPRLSIQGATKRFETNKGVIEALQPIFIDIAEGEFLVLVGPSGCGKSTLLNLIAGLEQPSEGEVLVDGKPVKGPGYDRLMLFQEHALFPWLNVLHNVEFGLKRKKKLNKKERREVAQYYLKLVRLEKFENSYIHELSGGMRQRVALARALAPNPAILLMDEPFGALDALTREELYTHLQEIWLKTRRTIVFVTHNVREAACLGDRVCVFSGRPGRIKCCSKINLPRIRRFYDPEVTSMAAHILGELKTEVFEMEKKTNEESNNHDRVLHLTGHTMGDGI